MKEGLRVAIKDGYRVDEAYVVDPVAGAYYDTGRRGDSIEKLSSLSTPSNGKVAVMRRFNVLFSDDQWHPILVTLPNILGTWEEHLAKEVAKKARAQSAATQQRKEEEDLVVRVDAIKRNIQERLGRKLGYGEVSPKGAMSSEVDVSMDLLEELLGISRPGSTNE